VEDDSPPRHRARLNSSAARGRHRTGAGGHRGASWRGATRRSAQRANQHRSLIDPPLRQIPYCVQNVEELEALGPNPTILCWEKVKDIEAGTHYCHRHLVAKWLEDTIGMKVEEVGHPDLPRFRYLNEEHVAAPSYARRERVDLFP
jgi:hypothetical protein